MSSMPHKKEAQEWYVLTEEKLDDIGTEKKQVPESLCISWLLKVACQNPQLTGENNF